MRLAHSHSRALRSLGGLLALILTPTAFALNAEDGEGGSQIVSEPLMQVLESWSEPLNGIEAAVLEAHPEVIHDYAGALRAHLRGRSLLEHLGSEYPQAAAEILVTLPAEAQNDAEVLAYLMSAREAEYQAFQAERGLQESGLVFADFVGQRYPEIAAEIERQAPSPSSRGVALLDFVAELRDPQLESEARHLLDAIEWKPFKKCACWTVLTFPHQPDPWQTEINENHSSSWGWAPKKERQLNYYVGARGAAKDINFYRRSRHNVWEVDRIKGTNYSHMRVRMLCTQNGQPGGVECQGSTCRGDLAARVAYASRVRQQVDFGGPWSKGAFAIGSDWARLKYDPPGAPPMTTLFSKGVAVSGATSSTWNSEAIIQVLTTAAQVGLVVATDGSAAGALLEGNLVNETITALFGLVKRQGSPSSHHQDMFVAWDTANTAAITLLPNQTHLFELDTLSKVYGRGFGGDSKTWAGVDSSAYLAAVTRNYVCNVGVSPPTPRAHWFWATSGTPHSSVTIQNLVKNYVQTELGVLPNNVSQQVGQYP